MQASTASTPRPTRRDRLPHLLLWGVLSLVLAGVVGFGVWSLIWDRPLQPWPVGTTPAHLPVYGSVPNFALVDQLSRPVRRTDLDGKLWVASLIFTNCPDECPLMTSEMARLQSDLASMADLRLVSISVDPERDTPVVLSHYAARFQADPERWLFLTGDKGEIHRLAREGFRLGLAAASGFSPIAPVPGSAAEGLSPAVERPLGSGVGQLTSWPHTLRRWLGSGAPALAFADHGRAKDTLHSTRFVLIDRLGQIRGYYESREQAALERLRQHLQMLFQNG